MSGKKKPTGVQQVEVVSAFGPSPIGSHEAGATFDYDVGKDELGLIKCGLVKVTGEAAAAQEPGADEQTP